MKTSICTIAPHFIMRLLIMKRGTKADWKNAVKEKETGRCRKQEGVLNSSINSGANHKAV